MAEQLHQTPSGSDFCRLIDKLIDDSLLPADQLALESRIRQEPAARDLYLLYTDMHAHLHWLTMGEPASRLIALERSSTADPLADLVPLLVERAVSVPPPEATFTRAKLGRWIGATMMVACVVVLMALLTTPRPRVENLTAEGLPAASGGNTPRINSATDSTLAVVDPDPSARWRPGAERKPGETLKSGDTCELISGTAVISFTRGAQVVLEGPATFVLQDADSGFLRRGKLAAKVPQQAIGFAVDSPQARVVDLGTEFGVDVDERGNVDVEVFAGKVDVTATASNAATRPPSIQLSAGQSSRVQGGVLQPGVSSGQKFAAVRKSLPEIEQDVELVLDDVKLGWDAPQCWSDNRTPHLSAHYHVGRGKAKRVRTPGNVPEHLFLGGLLTIHESGELLLKVSNRPKKLVSLRLDGGRISIYGTGEKQVMEVQAPLQIVAPSRLDFRTRSVVRWSRDITGDSPLQVSGAGELWLAADCSRYRGDLTIDDTTLIATQPDSLGTGRLNVTGGGRFAPGCDLERPTMSMSFDHDAVLVLNHALIVGAIEFDGKPVAAGEYLPSELRKTFGANVEGKDGKLVVVHAAPPAKADDE